MGHWIELDSAAGPVKAWRCDPPGTPRGALVVVQEVFGVNPHIRSVAEAYAAEGYATLAPSMFDPVEPGVELEYTPEGIRKGVELMEAIGFERALQIVEAAAAYLAQPGHTGIVGYCWGGGVAYAAAVRLGIPASSYYGGRSHLFLDEQPQKAPAIFHFGDKDASIPPETVQKHRAKFGEAVFTYPAGHAFNRDADPKVYHADSARLAKQRTLAFFAERLQ